MDDPWGSNAWSTPSEEGQDVSKRSVATRWTAFERDADEETADVAAPTWNEVTESMWDGGVNLWNASSSTHDVWKPPASPRQKSVEGGEDQMSAASEETAAVSSGNAALEHTVRIPSPRPILPTPPLSPPPVSIPRSQSPVEEVALPEVQLVSQDPFGSFESAETADKNLLDESWSPGTAEFPPEATEPWGNTWSTAAEERNKFTRDDADEWELAQEAKRKRDRKVPRELLSSLLTQWETVADEIYGKVPSDSKDSKDAFSWRNGLDNVENLSELMETFLPPASFPLPVPLSKTRLSKSVKDALRLTRSFAMTQSSPMARLYASKGSTDWERAVQSQNTSAQDNWGWDLKYELEVEKEKDGEKEKRSTGFLSLWGRKSSTLPNSSPVSEINSSSINKPPGIMLPLNSSPPLASTRPSIDISSGAPSDIPVQQEVISLPAPNTIDSATTVPNEAPSSQPSAMSRFWNKLSKRASTPLPGISDDKEKGKHNSLQQVSLSVDELSFLSDVPSGMSSKPQATVDSIEAMLTMPSKATSSKLPLPLAPPPSFVSTPSIQNSTGNLRSDDSPERQKVHAPLTDLLDSATSGYGGGGKGYASVLFDPLESPKKNEQLLPSTLRNSSSLLGPVFSHPMPITSPLPPPPTSHATQSMGFGNLFDKRLEQSRSEYSPPVPLLRPPVGHTSRTNLSSGLSLSSSPVLQPPVGSTECSLPPTLMKTSDSRDQLSDFISGSSPDHRTSSSLFGKPAGSTTFGFAGSLVAVPAESDIGDFGDFVSTPPLSPEPSKLAQSIKPISFAQSASGRPGSMAGSVGGATSNAGRLSVGTPPPRIAPPPGSSAGRQKTVNFLDDDFATVDLSVPTSKAKPFFPLSSQSSSPTISPPPVTAQRGKSTGQSGLSAQDLSFFEGL